MVGHDISGDLARRMIELRADRSRFFEPGLFGEGGWELLLVLYVADTDGVSITVADAFARCAGRQGALERWLQHLYRSGLINGNFERGMAAVVTLSPVGIGQMERFLAYALST